MTGAHAALANAGGATASTFSNTPTPTPVWADIYVHTFGSDAPVTIAGITVPISISMSRTGSGTIYYGLNGSFTNYSAPFTVNAGDLLQWGAKGSGTSGAITVTNATTSTVLDTINYTVT